MQKEILYSEFLKIPLEKRKQMAQQIMKNDSNLLPLIVKNYSRAKGWFSIGQNPQQLPMWKFKVPKNMQFLHLFQQLRIKVMKDKKTKLRQFDSIFFFTKNKVIGIKDSPESLYNKLKNQYQDGWIVIDYKKIQAFG